jgi:hypothetical protein
MPCRQFGADLVPDGKLSPTHRPTGLFEIVSKPVSGATTETSLLRANSRPPGRLVPRWQPVYEALISGQWWQCRRYRLVTIDGGKPTPLVTSRFEDGRHNFSDGRWLATSRTKRAAPRSTSAAFL